MVLSKDGDSLPFEHPRKLLSTLAQAAEMKMGGTSGAIYALFLTAVSSATPDDCNNLSDKVLARIWQNGLDGIKRYSKARVGDRTMVTFRSFKLILWVTNISYKQEYLFF